MEIRVPCVAVEKVNNGRDGSVRSGVRIVKKKCANFLIQY